MSKHKAMTPDDPAQSKAFLEKAREIGADEKRSLADVLIGRMAKVPPQPKAKPKTKSEKPDAH